MAVVYIAGKMNGLPDKGRAKFAEAAEKLRGLGFVVLNPAELPEGLAPDKYMPICLAMIDAADAVCKLDNWHDSPGANIEVRYAQYQGKSFLSATEKERPPTGRLSP